MAGWCRHPRVASGGPVLRTGHTRDRGLPFESPAFTAPAPLFLLEPGVHFPACDSIRTTDRDRAPHGTLTPPANRSETQRGPDSNRRLPTPSRFSGRMDSNHHRIARTLHHAGARMSSVCLQESLRFWKQRALSLRGENQPGQSTCSTVTVRLASDTKRYCSGRIGPVASMTSTSRSARSPCSAGTDRSSSR